MMVSLLLMFYSFFLVHCLILLGGNKLEADTELALPKEGGGRFAYLHCSCISLGTGLAWVSVGWGHSIC